MIENLKKLREPFPPNQISLLPKPKSKDAPKGKCPECGGWHGLPAVHLSYVGHAALTDRLLDVDPSWTWEPLAMTADGLPVMDPYGGMWIKLTVCGVTRLGYGHAGDKQGGDAIKEVIGDALRNAAMRFGAALDLWHKGDLHAHEEESEPAKPKLGGPVGAQVIASIKTPLTDAQKRHVEDNVRHITDAFEAGGAQGGFERIQQEDFDDMQKIYLSTLLPSNIRNPITAYSREYHSKAKATA